MLSPTDVICTRRTQRSSRQPKLPLFESNISDVRVRGRTSSSEVANIILAVGPQRGVYLARVSKFCQRISVSFRAKTFSSERDQDTQMGLYYYNRKANICSIRKVKNSLHIFPVATFDGAGPTAQDGSVRRPLFSYFRIIRFTGESAKV